MGGIQTAWTLKKVCGWTLFAKEEISFWKRLIDKSEENGTENAHTRVEGVSSFEISQVFALKKFTFTQMWM